MQNSEVKQPPPLVDGVVLAAGRSTRMGSPKHALEANGETFIARAVNVLRQGGCRDVVAVIGADDSAAGTAASEAGARVVINVAEESEQIDSLRLALRNLDPGALGALVLPVDNPLVTSATVRAVLDAWVRARPPIARASHAGTPGHPTLFAATLFDELLEDDLPDGARSVIATHERDLLDVPVDDAGVTTDIDTPDDYRNAFGGDA